MIPLSFRPLEKEQVERLQRWLNQPERGLAVSVLSALAVQQRVEAVKELGSETTNADYVAELVQAGADYERALNLLEAMGSGQQEDGKAFEYLLVIPDLKPNF